MKNTTQVKLFVIALCITNSFCFGQQNRSAICRLGEITNDSILPYIQSLEVDCNKDVNSYLDKSEQLSSVKEIELLGDANPNDWEKLFAKIKTQATIKTVVFKDNTFSSLPYGFEGLYSVETVTFKNNEELDYTSLLDQLGKLPNVKHLSLEVLTIFDLPKQLEQLKNIETIRIINIDEFISKNNTTSLSFEIEPITYDYSVKKLNEKIVAIKYTAMAGEIDSDEYKELSKRFTTDNNYITSSMPFIPKYVNVDPPIKGIDVERENYLINPKIENIVTYPSGTKIRIPANTFIDKNGNPVAESVTISYREFRDPVEFLVSGIPMKYDTAGEVTNFESAGMFELLASSNNEAISVAKDKNIDMNFATTSKDSTYNFYSFNDSTGNWEYLNKPKTVTSQTLIEIKLATRAYNIYQSYANNNKRIPDKTTFGERFNDTNYVYTNRKEGNSRIYYRANGKPRNKSMSSLVKINNVKKTKDGTVLFKIDYLNTSHPEMSEFENVYFALSEEISPALFKEKYGRRKYYSDIRVTTKGNDVELQLKDRTSIKNISANIVMLDNQGKPKEIKNVSTRMKRYNRRLKTREKKFNSDIAKGKRNVSEIIISDRKQLSLYAYNEAKKAMTNEEKQMSYKEWLDYCKQTEKNMIEWNKQASAVKIAQLNNAEATPSNLIQSMSLSGTGIYNCDQIQRMKQPVEIFAKYKSLDNKKVEPQMAYLLDKTSNSVFQYDGYRGFSADKIAFSKNKAAKNTLLAVNSDGTLAVYKTEEFAKTDFKNKSHFDFVVTPIDSKVTSVADLKTLIGF